MTIKVSTEAAGKLSALSSRKVDKFEYLTGEKLLNFDHSKMMQQAKFTYTNFQKKFQKNNQKPLKTKEPTKLEL